MESYVESLSDLDMVCERCGCEITSLLPIEEDELLNESYIECPDCSKRIYGRF